MKIAQLAPPWLCVPPKGYGGTETVVHYLTEGLVARGHDVTLFATGDSKTSAKLSYIYPKEIGNSGLSKQDSLHPLLHYIECFDRAEEFDVIHNHAQYFAMFFSELVKTPVVHTLHGSFSKEYTSEEKLHTLKRFKKHNFITISNSQRLDMPDLNYVGTVYNGTKISEFQFREDRGNHLVWFGRLAEKKGPLEAILAAKQINMQIIVAGIVDDVDSSFFNAKVLPHCDNQAVCYTKEIAFDQKSDLLGAGFATLFPILWEEPFGLVMTESMACGTPVIAFNRGSVAEVIKDGVTGFIVDSDNEDRPGKGSWIVKKQGVEGLVEAIRRMQSMPDEEYKTMRRNARKHVEDNFSVEKMVEGYEKIYEAILHSR